MPTPSQEHVCRTGAESGHAQSPISGACSKAPEERPATSTAADSGGAPPPRIESPKDGDATEVVSSHSAGSAKEGGSEDYAADPNAAQATPQALPFYYSGMPMGAYNGHKFATMQLPEGAQWPGYMQWLEGMQLSEGMQWPGYMQWHGYQYPMQLPGAGIITTNETTKKKKKEKKDLPEQLPGETKWSEYVGVCWNARVRKWAVQSRVDGKTIYLGYFVNEEDAGRKYDEHAAGLGRPVNFPGPTQVKAQKGAPRHRNPGKRKLRDGAPAADVGPAPEDGPAPSPAPAMQVMPMALPAHYAASLPAGFSVEGAQQHAESTAAEAGAHERGLFALAMAAGHAPAGGMGMYPGMYGFFPGNQAAAGLPSSSNSSSSSSSGPDSGSPKRNEASSV